MLFPCIQVHIQCTLEYPGTCKVDSTAASCAVPSVPVWVQKVSVLLHWISILLHGISVLFLGVLVHKQGLLVLANCILYS